MRTELAPDAILALPAGRELDALVAEKVMGLNVLGEAHCAHPEGDWYICGGRADYTGDYGTIRPVYLHECKCDSAKEANADLIQHDPELADAVKVKEIKDTVLGHIAYACLEVVPCYSTSIAAAWEVVEHKFPGAHVELERDEAWGNKWSCTIGRIEITAKTAPLAICYAALKVVMG